MAKKNISELLNGIDEIESENKLIDLLHKRLKIFSDVKEIINKEVEEKFSDKSESFKSEIKDELISFFKKYIVDFLIDGKQLIEEDPVIDTLITPKLLYYVGKPIKYGDMKIKIKEHTYFFTLDKNKQKNEKAKIYFTYDVEKVDNNQIYFSVQRSNRFDRRRVDKLYDKLKDMNIKKEEIKKVVEVFEAQTKIDFFLLK